MTTLELAEELASLKRTVELKEMKIRIMLDTLNSIGAIVGLLENHSDGDELIRRVKTLASLHDLNFQKGG